MGLFIIRNVCSPQIATIHISLLSTTIKKNKIVSLIFNMGLNIFTILHLPYSLPHLYIYVITFTHFNYLILKCSNIFCFDNPIVTTMEDNLNLDNWTSPSGDVIWALKALGFGATFLISYLNFWKPSFSNKKKYKKIKNKNQTINLNPNQR